MEVANIYVSAAGRLQLINRYDLNQDGHLDLFIGTGHGHNEDEDVYAYLNNGVEIDPRRRILIPAGGAIDGLVTDLNKDGRSDLVIVNTAGGVTNLTSTYVYLHDGIEYWVYGATAHPTHGMEWESCCCCGLER